MNQKRDAKGCKATVRGACDTPVQTLLCRRVGPPGCASGDSDASVAQSAAFALGACGMTRNFFECMALLLVPVGCCFASSELSALAVCAPVDVAGLLASDTYCPSREPSDAKLCGAGEGTRSRCDVEARSLAHEGATPASPSGMLGLCICMRGEGLLELRRAEVWASAVKETVPSGPRSEDSSCREVPPRGVRVASSWKRTRELVPRAVFGERVAEWKS